MASKTEIANMALLHIGVTKPIANIETEDSNEATACRVFFNSTRDMVLRAFTWPFAAKTVTLALVEEDPTTEWAYSYSYPPDCLKLKRIFSGVRNDPRQTRVPYRVLHGTSGSVIYTDMQDAVMEYTAREEDVLRYPADFQNALSLRLAAYIAGALTRGDPFKLGRRALDLYLFEIGQARSNAANEEQAEEPPQSEFVREREQGTSDETTYRIPP